MDYIESSNATTDDLKPKAKLYKYEGVDCYVARIGMVDDWAVYKGQINCGLDQVAKYGVKILDEEIAAKLFPICVEAGLTYRLP